MREIKFRAWDKTAAEMIGQFNVGVGGNSDGKYYNIMQYTGLKDKNGKEIYEGDICWAYEIGIGNLNRVIEFNEGSFCLIHANTLSSELRGWKTDYIEVIGNIYQNPELLKQ